VAPRALTACPIFPATKLISEMDAGTVRSQYIFYIGAGAVTTAGLISLLRALPTILSAMLGSFKGFRGGDAGIDAPLRTQRDLPMWIVAVGTVILAVLMIVVPQIRINVLGAILAIFFAFLFVTVSSRITGQIGASANPISGMTIATVLLTSLVFLAVGWTGIEHRVLALSIGGVVCVAAAVAGATSQDLKTGYLVGATPARQQIALVFGVVTSAVLIGFIIQFLNEASTTIVARQYAGVVIPSSQFDNETRTLKDGTTYRVGHLYEQTGQAPAGKYLVDQSGAIKYLVDPGIGGKEETDYTGRKIKKLDSPKSQIMALVVDGILTRKLPWGLLLIGAFLAIAMEILGVPSLPVAVGVYLPISTSATIFMGGMVRLLIERRMSPEQRNSSEADSGPGVLFASGLIAGGALMNVAVQALVAKEMDPPAHPAWRSAGTRRREPDPLDVALHSLSRGAPLPDREAAEFHELTPHLMISSESLGFLKKLLDTPGPSGFESAPAKVWREQAKQFAKVTGDVAGNSLAEVNGGGSPTIMLAGHIDEIGVIISYIDDQGYGYIQPIGWVGPASAHRPASAVHWPEGRCIRRRRKEADSSHQAGRA